MLHVADCCRVDYKIDSSSAQQSIACNSDCCEHSAETPKSDEQDEGNGDHDSESCSICQSLVTPAGVSWGLELPHAVAQICEEAASTYVQVARAKLLSSIYSRGPPHRVA